MKSAIAFPCSHDHFVSVLLTLCLFVLVGSSGCGTGDTAGAGAGSLDESEIAALKKESKNGREFIASLKRKTREKAGVVDPIDELKKNSREVPSRGR